MRSNHKRWPARAGTTLAELNPDVIGLIRNYPLPPVKVETTDGWQARYIRRHRSAPVLGRSNLRTPKSCQKVDPALFLERRCARGRAHSGSVPTVPDCGISGLTGR